MNESAESAGTDRARVRVRAGAGVVLAAALFLSWGVIPWAGGGSLTLGVFLVGGLASLGMGGGTLWLLGRLESVRCRWADRTRAWEAAEQALREEKNARFAAEVDASTWRQALERCPIPLVQTDAAGNVAFINDGYRALVGESQQEEVGERLRLIEDGLTVDDQRRSLHKAMESGGVWQGDFWGMGANGNRLYLQATMAGVPGAEGEGRRLFAIQDISERKRLQEQFLQSQKMEIIGRLAGGVVHDLSNMLTVIMGFAQLVQCELDEDHALREEVDEIVRVTERASTLNRQLLTFARTRAHQAERVVMDVAIKDLDKFLQRTLGEDVELRMELDAGSAAITIDPGQLNQLLMNLAVNARDAMPQGGELTVETRLVDLPVEFCRAHRLRPGQYIQLRVRDSGVGMTPDVRERLFEPFFTTKAEGKGTGLGLSTVQEIVQRFGGSIQVASTVGKGSEFEINFSTCRTGASRTQVLVEEQCAGGSETVMVVEDDRDVRRLIVALMEGLGYRVLEASSGKEALSLCTLEAGALRLVISDVIMPEMDGVKLARKLRTLVPEVGIVLVTGFAEHPIVNGASEEHFDCILQKPFNRTTLAAAARRVLDEQGRQNPRPETPVSTR